MLFVVSGNENNRIFKDKNNEKDVKNLIYTGYLNDGELVTLYKNCKAFIFPSLYEGFGIPPLEAIECGCKNLILSDIEVLKEIYGNNAVYIDTKNYIKLPEKLIEADIDELLEKSSWKKTATLIINVLNEYIELK